MCRKPKNKTKQRQRQHKVGDESYSEDALARFTWTPNDNGGHCHHAIDAPQRRNFVAFVRGEELPDKHPWPDACPKCRDDRERALAEEWLTS